MSCLVTVYILFKKILMIKNIIFEFFLSSSSTHCIKITFTRFLMGLSTNTQQINCHSLMGRDTYMHLATFFIFYLFLDTGYKTEDKKQSLQRKIAFKRETKRHTLLLLAPMTVEITFVFMHLAPYLLTTVESIYHSLQQIKGTICIILTKKSTLIVKTELRQYLVPINMNLKKSQSLEKQPLPLDFLKGVGNIEEFEACSLASLFHEFELLATNTLYFTISQSYILSISHHTLKK